MTRRASDLATLPAAKMIALAVGAVAVGTVAIGAIAIGRIALGGLVVHKARFRSMEIDDLTVRRLRVLEPGREVSAETE